MQAVSADPWVPEPTPENSGTSEGLRRSHLNNGVLEKFAQNMTESIIQSFMSQMEMVLEPEVDFGVSRFDQNQEMLAEELASTVIEVALKDVCGGQNTEDPLEGGQKDLVLEPEVDFGVSRFDQNQEMLGEELASTVIEVALKEACRGRNTKDPLQGGQKDLLEMVLEPEADFGVSRFDQNQEMLAEELASTVIEVALKEACRGRNTKDPLEGGQKDLLEMVLEPEVDFGVSRFDQNQEMLAEELASTVIEVALREVWRVQNNENTLEGGQKDLLDLDTEMDQGKEIQTSIDTQPCRPTLSQSGLPIVGSLDYPDAPPTTPLLPELERSRHSFARKLKGGLAKVFLPSPPPPTPKDKEDDSDSAAIDPRVELMEHLMQSLPTDDLARDYFEVGPHHGAKMEAFAEALSCDIINWVLSGREQIDDDSDLHLLAHRLAGTIITSSLDEARMLV